MMYHTSSCFIFKLFCIEGADIFDYKLPLIIRQVSSLCAWKCILNLAPSLKCINLLQYLSLETQISSEPHLFSTTPCNLVILVSYVINILFGQRIDSTVSHCNSAGLICKLDCTWRCDQLLCLTKLVPGHGSEPRHG